MKYYYIYYLLFNSLALVQGASTSKQGDGLLKLAEKTQCLAQYTGASYCSDESLLENWECPFHCEKLTEGSKLINIIYDRTTDVRGIFVRNDRAKRLILSFRGSNSPINWKLNSLDNLVPLNLDNKPLSKAKRIPLVHQGFLDATKSVREQYLKSFNDLFMKEPELRSYKTYVTGHSFGGAIANLASLDLIETLKLNNIEVFTFGQPRVGNKEFVKYIKSKIRNYTRAINGKDPVPIAISPQKGYLHGPVELHYTPIDKESSKILVGSVDNGEDNTGINSEIEFTADDHFSILGIPLTNLCDNTKPPFGAPVYEISDNINQYFKAMLKSKKL